MLVVISIAFAAINLEIARINYFFGISEVYVCVLVFVTLLIGGIIGALFSYPSLLKARRENARLRKQLEQAHQPDENLRAIPLQKQA